MTHVALFDYGAGNLHSLKKGLEAGGTQVTVTSDWTEALGRDALVLPGVGSFGAAVRGLEGEADRVRDALLDGLPCLGICLGMQLLFPASEEAQGRGIGLISGQVRRLRARIVPQMGWNDVEIGDDEIFRDAAPFPAYYANSFICDVEAPDADSIVIAKSEYEGEEFAAAVHKARTWGLQFHPEKSSNAGLRVLANFVKEVAR
ncbi:MAG: imidazole glycerol phosphate synthase subunit HisH [Gemmatimonadota bacterium]